FAQILAVLQQSGTLSLEQVMHDGTKIRAQAGADTYRREKSMREHLREAQEVVSEMGDPKAEAPAQDRKAAARKRAARERVERLEGAVKELEKLQAEERKE